MVLQNVLQLLALLGALCVAAAVGRLLARLARLPSVIGEIVVSLLLGPALLATGGPAVYAAVLPQDLLAVLKEIGEAGLVLYLVGLVHRLDHGPGGLRGRGVRRITIGSLGIPLVAGLAFAGWVLWLAPPELRGHANASALVLMLAVTMSVTAVPVLARIIEERKAALGRSAELAMMASMLIDTLSWLLLAVALGLRTGGIGGVLQAFVVLAVGGAIAWAAHRGLATAWSTRLCASSPRLVAVVLGAVAITAGTGIRLAGLTAVFGAFLVGIMVPRTEGWSVVVRWIGRIGRALVPVYFVVAGTTVFTGGVAALPWLAVVLAVALGILGKVLGGYLGARWGGEDRLTSVRIGVLVNTRGLTEIVVLQVGYTAGLLTPGLLVALLVMALLTTALTGPLLDLVDRRTAAGKALPVGESAVR
ncbi:cation:proton antiporter [Kutzneria sp. CA-103260]|uniref:cation:proton antiporter n=1 Tax=Kutzneria sp. CA-103260 TaxID=2802641 RepID=UPI001BA72B11|nr:cation:proton antiporter [Kutzneria sp. CA-103260]QUQ64188.1 cation:proton antiporter [Kutzneria sp. CA-103260]